MNKKNQLPSLTALLANQIDNRYYPYISVEELELHPETLAIETPNGLEAHIYQTLEASNSWDGLYTYDEYTITNPAPVAKIKPF